MNNFQAEFERFMLGEQDNTTPKSTVKSISSSTPLSPLTPSHIIKNAEKKYWNFLRTFQSILQRDWLRVDDNLGQLMESISNLRQRIYWESQQIKEIKERKNHFSMKELRNKSWTLNCSSRQGKVYLLKQDIKLALSHDLRQHELMMSGVRSLISNLNQAQETLGRRLEEMLIHDMHLREEDFDVNPKLPGMIITMEHIYHCLAEELYRKQMLTIQVLESSNNHLFIAPNCIDYYQQSIDNRQQNPRTIAHSCKQKWSRASKHSYIRESQLQYLLQMNGTSE